MKNMGNYYVGFDIGTNSVGWAVTDEQYKLYKFNGHKMWGVRIFEEAETALARRTHRSARRRLQRRHARIQLLQELFSSEITKVDPGFFQRLEDSKYYLEDKKVSEKHTLFVGSNYNDVDYYKEYPTIYHLRSALMKEEQKHDIRLIYLAIHHIIKYRGHFLYPGEKLDSCTNIDETLLEIFENTEVSCENQNITEEKLFEIKTIIFNGRMTKSDKKRELKGLFPGSKQLESIFGLAVGTKENLSNIFDCEEYKDLEADVAKISFSEKIYDEVRGNYEEVLEDKILLIDSVKKIYDSMILSGRKKEGLSLSDSQIEFYKKHNRELKDLKALIKAYSKDEYKKMFSLEDEKIANYKNYIGDGQKKCNREDFYKYIKSVLEKVEDCDKKKEILEEIALENYLPLQRIKENGVIPYQLHEEELLKILENASQHYEFLNEEENDISVKDKIHKILTFRIPYYVGPLNTTHEGLKNGFAWAIKRSEERITPWNFEEIVDLEASHEKFINRMTNKCTYLKGMDVLPKNSLLYSEYMLLNELNNLKCDGQSLPIEVRDLLINKLFKNCEKKTKVTVNKIKDLLKKEGYIDGLASITGIDIEVKADLKSYRDFKNILGDSFNYNMVENIIKWLTLYSEEVKSVGKRIKEKYADHISEEQIKKICKLKYKDWGRLSKEFLIEIESEQFTDFATGEVGNIINAMRNNNLNLMQLLGNQYDFIEKIKQRNSELFSPTEKISHEILEDLYISPAVRRMIWQTLLIMEEIKKIMGKEPEKIFIETVRSNKAEKKRTDTRKKRLLELYAACKKEAPEWASEIQKKTDADLRSKKLFLYYLQMGQCMYSGETIDLTKLMQGEEYDIDHIFPRSKTKDDSFDNLVLVKKQINAHKTDEYPIGSEIQDRMKSRWKYLMDKGFISSKKYERLTRKNGFEPQELADFIARQLVETSQSTKAVAEIMSDFYKKSKVVYVKAENVSHFRDKKKFIKVREINDFHHANDAYLNIVVGNVFDTKFTSNPVNFVKEAKYREYNLERMYDFRVERNGIIAWDGKDGKTIKLVRAEMESRDIRLTKKSEEQKGQLFDLTVYKKEKCKPESYLGTKNVDERLSDVRKYGGYTSIKIAYLVAYGCNIKNKKGEIEKIRRVTGVPVYLSESLKSKEQLENFIRGEVPIKKDETIDNLLVADAKLRVGSLIKYNGFLYYLGGKTAERFYANNAIQLSLEKQFEAYIKELVRYTNKKKADKDFKIENLQGKINSQENLALYEALTEKMRAPIYMKATQNKYDTFSELNVKERFINLELEEQTKILLEMLNILTNKKSVYDLKSVGVSASRRVIGFNLSEVQEFELINQSITGLFENKTNLLV